MVSDVLVQSLSPVWITGEFSLTFIVLFQIHKVVLALGDYLNCVCHACIGGTSVRADMMKLQATSPQIVVGTPGRVFDMMQRKAVRKFHTGQLWRGGGSSVAMFHVWRERADLVHDVRNPPLCVFKSRCMVMKPMRVNWFSKTPAVVLTRPAFCWLGSTVQRGLGGMISIDFLNTAEWACGC